MNRLFPAPLLGSLFGLWLLLNLSVSPGNLLLGAALGVLAPLLMAPLRPQHAHVRRPLVIARLIGVGMDVIISNLLVARGVLRAGSRHAPRSSTYRWHCATRTAWQRCR
jgi:multicomponent K+:H+ antiporter subunit E